MNQIPEETIVGYLFGTLSAAEEQLIDEQLAAPGFYTAVASVEDRLTDEYVQGQLLPADQKLFEQRLLRTSRQRERVRLAQTFFRVIDEDNIAKVARAAQSLKPAIEINDETMRRYLLGALNDEQQRIVEEQLCEQEGYDAITSVENHLVDDYVLGRLSDTDQQCFEQRLLRTERQRERVRVARTFFQVVDESNCQPETVSVTSSPGQVVPTEPAPSWWQSFLDWFRIPNLVTASGMVAATLLFLAGGAFFAWEAWRLRGQGANAQEQIAQLQQREQTLVRQTEEQRARYEGEIQATQNQLKNKDDAIKQTTTRNEDLQKQLQSLEKSSQLTARLGRGLSASIMTVAPPIARGGADDPVQPVTLNTFTLSKDGVAIFNVRVDEREFDSYRAVVATAAGVELVVLNQLKVRESATARVLIVSFPASNLTAGDYVLKVFGRAKGKETLLSEFRFPIALK